MPRAQISIEAFLVFSLLALVVIWLANFSGVFSDSAYSSSLLSQQRAVAASVASLAGQVCVTKSNVSYQLPCLSRGSPAAVLISSANSSLLTVSSSAGSVSIATPCVLNVSYAYSCSSEGEWACILHKNSFAQLVGGRCS